VSCHDVNKDDCESSACARERKPQKLIPPVVLQPSREETNDGVPTKKKRKEKEKRKPTDGIPVR